MSSEEILRVLKEGANFEMERTNFGWYGWGSISNFPDCMFSLFDYNTHYKEKKKLLESLPWEMVVKDPRNPKLNEYPTEDGEYITMLDCNEHEVICNRFVNGAFLKYNKTHVKWWMLNPFW